jgi:hypothetical protein
MDWLQKLNPGNSGAKLYTDVAKQRAAFATDLAGIPCEAWNPVGDLHTATRILGRVVTEELSARNQMTLRDLYRASTLPLSAVPKTSLSRSSFEDMLQMYARPFDSLRYAPNSPRDLLIRGQLQQATSSLEDTKRVVENARTRMEQDKGLQQDFERWSKTDFELSAALNRAKLNNPSAIPTAAKALEDFRNHPANRDIERAFVLGNASRPLAADVTYLMAACVHERAERSQLDNPTQAVAHWRNASEWWERFLDASSQAQSPFPAREPHARALLARCRQFTGK